MRQENEGTGQTDSHRYQLNHRTHHSRATPRSIKGALPFQDVAWKNGLVTPGRRRNLADPVTDWQAGLGPAPLLHVMQKEHRAINHGRKAYPRCNQQIKPHALLLPDFAIDSRVGLEILSANCPGDGGQ